MKMTTGLVQKAEEMDLVGDVLTNALKFFDSGFDGNIVLHDGIAQEEIPANEMFREVDGRWYLRSASLPGITTLCAVAVDKNALYIEASPLDEKAFVEWIRERSMPFIFRRKQRTIVDFSRRMKLSVSLPKKPNADSEGELPARCLYTLRLIGLDKAIRWKATALIDQMFTKSVFSDDYQDEPSSTTGGQSMRLVLNMRLMNTLDLIQRPILSLRQKLGVTARREMRVEQTQIQALLATQYAILDMSRENLEAFTLKQVAERGEDTVMRVFIFVLAGRVKKIKPTLTWKQARLAARGLVDKPAQK